MASSSSGSAGTTIEDLQDNIDSMVLAVFEAARYEGRSEEGKEKTAKIKAEYTKAMNAIDQLRGVNRTKAEQMVEIDQLQKAQESARLRVLDLQMKLKTLEAGIFEEMDRLLPKELLGMSIE